MWFQSDIGKYAATNVRLLFHVLKTSDKRISAVFQQIQRLRKIAI